jgi:probable lipoprotein
MKRIVFATLLAFVAVILVACSSFTRSDNGVYVFEPSTEDIKSILKEQGNSIEGAELFIDQLKIKLTLEIKGEKGKISGFVSILGNKTEKSVDLKVDQKQKLISSKENDEKVRYKIEGDVLTFQGDNVDLTDEQAALISKFAKFKRVK